MRYVSFATAKKKDVPIFFSGIFYVFYFYLLLFLVPLVVYVGFSPVTLKILICQGHFGNMNPCSVSSFHCLFLSVCVKCACIHQPFEIKSKIISHWWTSTAMFFLMVWQSAICFYNQLHMRRCCFKQDWETKERKGTVERENQIFSFK